MITSVDYENILNFMSQTQEFINFRSKVLDLLANIFGFTKLTFFLVDEHGHFTDPVVKNISTETLSEYNEYFYKTDIFHTVNIPQKKLSQSLVKITDLMSYPQFEKTEFYNDLLHNMDVYHEIALPLNADNQFMGVIGILEPKDKGFTENQMLILDRLNKYISFNLKTYLNMTESKNESYIFKSCTYSSPIGVIVLNNKFSVLHYNDIALNFCQDIINRNNCPNYVEEVINKVSNKLLQQALNSNSYMDTFIDQYSFKINPFMVPNFNKGMETYYSVYIQKISSNECKKLTNAATFYNLTEREVELISLVLKGYSNKEISDELFISTHTVRTHIQNIFKKMNVNRRTALQERIKSFNI